MCDGGVATWKRSSGPRPRAAHQWAVAWPIDRCVWRTALGSPVVPELKTRITSSASERSDRRRRRGRWVGTGRGPSAAPRAAASSRSVTAAAPRRSASSAAAGPSATAWQGVVRPRAWSTSTAFHAGLNSTAAAPILLMAWTTATNSTRFDVITATRSPGPTPCATRWRANALARSSRSPKDQRSSPIRTASRSPKRSAARSRPRCIRVDAGFSTETLFSADEIDVNTGDGYCSRPWSRPAPPLPGPIPRSAARSSRPSAASSSARSCPSPPTSSRRTASRPRSSSRCAELGLFGVTIPEAHGGLGLDLLTYIGIIEELAYGWMSLTGIVNTHTMAPR